MAKNALDEAQVQAVLAEMDEYVEAARRVYFTGDKYPPLPGGLVWSAEVAGIVYLSTPNEENLFLPALLQHLDEFRRMDAGDQQRLLALIREQSVFMAALADNYKMLETAIAILAANPEEETA